MTAKTERASGIEILDMEVDEELQEGTEATVFRTDGPTRVQIGESAGNPLYVEAEYFVALSIDGTQSVDPMTAMMQGIEPEDDEVVAQDEETGELEIEVDEASIFVSNEDAEVGGGVVQLEGGDIEDALEEFEAKHLI